MNNKCIICEKEITSSPEIEAGACFDCGDAQTELRFEEEIVPLNFEEESYYGVNDIDQDPETNY